MDPTVLGSMFGSLAPTAAGSDGMMSAAPGIMGAAGGAAPTLGTMLGSAPKPQAPVGFKAGLPQGGLLGILQGKSNPQGLLGLFQGMNQPQNTGTATFGQAGMLGNLLSLFGGGSNGAA